MPLSASLPVTAALAFIALAAIRAEAVDLEWGPAGQGGDGAWNSANWWDGTSNVAWAAGGNATFGGVAGNVDSYVFGPSVSSLTFNTSGYLIRNGYLNASDSTLSVVTNADATISSTLSGGSGVTLVKSGPAKLTLAGTSFLQKLRIDAGELVATNTSSLFFSDVTLAAAPNVTLTVAPSGLSISTGGLSGGGALGGSVRPDAVDRTVTLTVGGGGDFAGILSDNLPGRLALTKGGSQSKVATLSGANTYSGATTVSLGTLIFSGSGSALNSAAVAVQFGGTLKLDNSSVANSNRFSDLMPVTLTAGTVELAGNATTQIEELLGTLGIAAADRLTVTQPGGATTRLTFRGFNRVAHGTLDLTGTAGVALPGLSNGASGSLPTFVTAGNDWATLNPEGRIEPITDYGNINAPVNHVKVTGSTALNGSASRATLNLQGTGTLDLGGNELTLREGGILASGGIFNIANGSVTASSAELVIVNRTDLAISANLSGGDVTKSGAGTLTLSGVNDYTGTTTINEGTLVVSSDANLGTGATIEFGLGKLKASGNFTSGKNLTRSTSYVSSIDTNGYDVTFTGQNSALQKSGAGKLTLSAFAVGSTSLTQGTLALPNAVSGSASLQGGTLLAAGVLDSVTISNDSILDIGGDPAATFQTGALSYLTSSPRLTLRMGVGTQRDLLTLTLPSAFFFLSTSSLLFDFSNLGGVQTGVNYTLISAPNSTYTPFTTVAALAPGELAEGWNASFFTTRTSIEVRFSTVPVPEPSAVWLLAVGLWPCAARRTGHAPPR